MNASSASTNVSQSKSANAPVGTGQERGTEKVFTPLVRQFLDYLRLEKHFSDYTIKSYGADLIQFGQFLGSDIGPGSSTARRTLMSPDDVDGKKLKGEPLTIREFLNYLYGQNYTQSTTAPNL